jgi:hypothetical protein
VLLYVHRMKGLRASSVSFLNAYVSRELKTLP